MKRGHQIGNCGGDPVLNISEHLCYFCAQLRGLCFHGVPVFVQQNADSYRRADGRHNGQDGQIKCGHGSSQGKGARCAGCGYYLVDAHNGVVCSHRQLIRLISGHRCQYAGGQRQDQILVFGNPFYRRFRRRYDGPCHVVPDLAQALLHDGQGRLCQLSDIWQNIGAQLRQKVRAQVFDHLNVIGQRVGLPLKGGVCRARGLVHFRCLAGQVFRLSPRHGQHGGLRLYGGEQPGKRQFIPAHGFFQGLQRPLQALALQQGLSAFIAHALQGRAHILGRRKEALHSRL